MIKISFIVVAYNAAQTLGALLDDLLAQTLAPEQLEALLVNSASSDGTRAIMEDFALRAPFDVKILENPRQWLASGINIALREASGDAVIRLDAHARIPRDFLSQNLKALERGEDLARHSVQRAEVLQRAQDAVHIHIGHGPGVLHKKILQTSVLHHFSTKM